jgi:hypothetical protein
MERIRLARAFTCYQMAALLEDLERAPRSGVPLLALDFLSTFADQNVATPERRRLLKDCLSRLHRLCRLGPVGVWVRARTVVPPEMSEFLERMERSSARVWRLDHAPSAGPIQPALL